SNKRFRRLLRLITRRYKSFKSLVAKRPPSSCTIGRISGGMTGNASSTIHSGLFPEFLNASTTSKRRIARVRSEEHTSELQSRFDLVCLLLPEKKKYHQLTIIENLFNY